MVKSTSEIEAWVLGSNQCDRCGKMGAPVKRTSDGDGPFCQSCFDDMMKLHDY